ncbi:advillin-like isoform X3 [Bolinopsis microptera]|uniref:advillin-like isoform X3 n=1 Tax=Bolinopsis microptera TaxID=2820187 RepID=UPI0030790D72
MTDKFSNCSSAAAHNGDSNGFDLMTCIDPAFQGVGQMAGVEIWRIEKMKVVAVPQDTHGKFYSGDSYIVLHTELINNRKEWHIHFWLGKETSTDEAGCAAIKSCELDDSLGGGPIQHREVQEYESSRFQSIFKQGIQYLEGGVDSGFVDISKLEFRKKLYHIKGRRKVRITQAEVSWRSLNEGDVFVLDCKDTVWCWIGTDCSRLEKIKGMEFARKIKDEEKQGRATMVLATPDDPRLQEKFYDQLNREDGEKVTIKSAEEGGDDEMAEAAPREIALYQVCDESGEIEISPVGKAPLDHAHLCSDDAFILDMGNSGVYAWIGKGATQQERSQAFMHAQKFINDKGYPSWTPLCRVVEGAEDNLFMSCFSNWPRPVIERQISKNAVIPEKIKDPTVDLSGLFKQQRAAEKKDDDVKDDGSGKLKIWRIENFELEEVDESTYGIFWDGDSYIVLYTYIQAGRNHESFFIYFWLGSHSTTDERGAAALHATKIDSEVGWSSQMVRVVQGKEPLHFLRCFGRRITILQGGVDSGFKQTSSEETNGHESTKSRLFHIKCIDEYVKSIEVFCKAESLNSNDSFVYLGQYKTYIWYGKGCDAEEKFTAKMLSEKLDRQSLIGASPLSVNTIEIEEGNEPDEFWEVLGGKAEYASGAELENFVNERPPRLFQLSNASGTFSVEEIYNFNQDDLIEDDVMLLDIGNTLYVWVGKGANEIEKKQSLIAAKEFIKNDPSGRSEADVDMFVVKMGFEPPKFTGHFQAWDPRKWADWDPSIWTGGKTYEEIVAEHFGGDANGVSSLNDELAKYSKKYPFEILCKKIVPEGVDVVNKERYLDDDDFLELFGMTLADYEALPRWKQLRAKKMVKLF